jgi:isoquinoline 1-oxidoreductase subunit alpha
LKAVAKSCAMRRLKTFMRAGDIMTRNVVSVSRETPASRVAMLSDIDVAITNICRCGTYQQVREAIHAAAEA